VSQCPALVWLTTKIRALQKCGLFQKELNNLRIRFHTISVCVYAIESSDFEPEFQSSTNIDLSKKYFSALQNIATQCNTLEYDTIRCNTQQHVATPCNTLQHAATRCNTLQHAATHVTHCDVLPHTAAHCNTLQHTATHCNTL
jgi:hypothetical protein